MKLQKDFSMSVNKREVAGSIFYVGENEVRVMIRFPYKNVSDKLKFADKVTKYISVEEYKKTIFANHILEESKKCLREIYLNCVFFEKNVEKIETIIEMAEIFIQEDYNENEVLLKYLYKEHTIKPSVSLINSLRNKFVLNDSDTGWGFQAFESKIRDMKRDAELNIKSLKEIEMLSRHLIEKQYDQIEKGRVLLEEYR